MSRKIGNIVADKIYNNIQEMISGYDSRPQIKLAVVQVGDDSASNIYIKYKRKACIKLGFGFSLFKLDDKSTTDEVLETIKEINDSEEISGCIIQLPLPIQINKHDVLNAVDPRKDVDCFHIENISRLYFGYDSARFVPATVYGIYALMRHFNVDTKGKTCVIIGKSNIVGKPLQMLLSDEMDMACTTIHCDKYTENLRELTKIADIIIVAAGVHHLIDSPDMIKKGATIIDVGIHRIKVGDKFSVQGDVNYDAVKDKCSLITPVPGGVGPVTVAALMFNLVKAYQELQN